MTTVAPDHVRRPTMALRPPRATPRARTLLYLAGLVATVVLAGFVVWPVVHSGYTGDDIPNSQIPMFQRANDLSFWEIFRDQNQYWIGRFGRLFPASSAETIWIFNTFSSRASYKAFQLATVLANVVLVVVFARRITRRPEAGVLAGALAAASLQMRYFHDPIREFSAQQEIVVALLLGSLLCVRHALERARHWWLVPALVLWLIALLTYETTYLLAPVYLLVAIGTGASRRRVIAASVVMLTPVLVLGGIVSYLRSQATDTAPQYTTNLEPSRVVRTFAIQTTAALPMSYSTLEPPPQIEPTAEAWDVTPLDVALFALTGALVVAAISSLGVVPWPPLVALGLTGGFLWTAPAVTVAVTSKWQDVLTPGTGYVSVYVQYFGVALALTAGAAGLVGLLRRRPSTARRIAQHAFAVAVAVLTAFAAQTTADNNDRVVHASAGMRWAREVLEQALARGTLDDVPAGSRVVSLNASDWVEPDFISWFGGPRVQVVNGTLSGAAVPSCASVSVACINESGAEYALGHEALTQHSGRVVLSRIAAAVEPAAGSTPTARLDASELWIYAEDPRIGRRICSAAFELTTRPSGTDAAPAAPVAGSEVSVVRSSPGWAVLHVRPRAGTYPGNWVDVRVNPVSC